MTAAQRNPSPKIKAHLDRLVADIIAALRGGTIPWVQPWDADRLVSTNGGLPYNGATGKAYRGFNIIMLLMGSSSCPEWMTSKQGAKLGGTLKASAEGCLIIFFGPSSSTTIDEVDSDGADDWHKFWEWDEMGEVKRNSGGSGGDVPFVGSAIVFNRMEFDGLKPSKYLKRVHGKALQTGERHPAAEDVIASTGATIHYGGNRAFFSPTTDSVTIPEFKDFHTSTGYYNTFFHELTHWTGGNGRLARTGGSKFGDNGYAFEELVAELGAAFVVSALGIAGEVNTDNVAYIQNWLKRLEDNPKFIMQASALAMQAFDFLKVPQLVVETEESVEPGVTHSASASHLALPKKSGPSTRDAITQFVRSVTASPEPDEHGKLPYRYGLSLRPAAPGAVPGDMRSVDSAPADLVPEGAARYGLGVWARKLTVQDCEHFDLWDLPEGDRKRALTVDWLRENVEWLSLYPDDGPNVLATDRGDIADRLGQWLNAVYITVRRPTWERLIDLAQEMGRIALGEPEWRNQDENRAADCQANRARKPIPAVHQLNIEAALPRLAHQYDLLVHQQAAGPMRFSAMDRGANSRLLVNFAESVEKMYGKGAYDQLMSYLDDNLFAVANGRQGKRIGHRLAKANSSWQPMPYRMSAADKAQNAEVRASQNRKRQEAVLHATALPEDEFVAWGDELKGQANADQFRRFPPPEYEDRPKYGLKMYGSTAMAMMGELYGLTAAEAKRLILASRDILARVVQARVGVQEARGMLGGGTTSVNTWLFETRDVHRLVYALVRDNAPRQPVLFNGRSQSISTSAMRNGPTLSGEIREGPDGAPSVIAFDRQQDGKRHKTWVHVPGGVVDWRKDLAHSPRRLSQPVGLRESPLVKHDGQTALSDAVLPNGDAVQVAWQVVDLSRLVVSNDPWSLEPNPAYPAVLQPRDRSRKSYADQIGRLVATFNPGVVMWSATASDGAPIIGDDGVVESGNGRTMALARIYTHHPEIADEYKRTVQIWARELGIPMPQVDQPVLVRVRLSELDRAEFARMANISVMQSMSSGEQATADAAQMTSELILNLIPDSSIGAGANRDFVETFIAQVAGRGARGQFVDEKGRLSKDGEERLDLAVFAFAYGPASQPFVNEIAEVRESDLKTALNGMREAAAYVAQFRAGIAQGGYLAALDPATGLVEMADLIRQAKLANQSIDVRLMHQTMFEPTSELAKAWIKCLRPKGPRMSAVALAAAIRSYCAQAALYPANQDDMFGEPAPSSLELIDRAWRFSQADAAEPRGLL